MPSNWVGTHKKTADGCLHAQRCTEPCLLGTRSSFPGKFPRVPAVALLFCPLELGFQTLQQGRLSFPSDPILTSWKERAQSHNAEMPAACLYALEKVGHAEGRPHQDLPRPPAGSSAGPPGPRMNPRWALQVAKSREAKAPLHASGRIPTERQFSPSVQWHNSSMYAMLCFIYNKSSYPACLRAHSPSAERPEP